MINDLNVVEIRFHQGHPNGPAEVVGKFRNRTIIPCNDPHCCGDFAKNIIPYNATSVYPEPRTRIRSGVPSEFYIAHEVKMPDPISIFEDQFHPKNVVLSENGVEIRFLGGIGSAGSASCAIVKYQGSSIMIDCGMTVAQMEADTNSTEIREADETLPDLYPDFSQVDDSLKAIFITHGHLDHFGGLQEFMRVKKPVPIYSHPFTTSLVASLFNKNNQREAIHYLTYIKEGDPIEIGPFRVTPFEVFHSVPHSFGYTIQIENQPGNIVFSGDLKARWQSPWDIFKTRETFEKLRPVELLVMDCTNATVPEHTGLESQVDEGFIDILQTAQRRVFVTLFSTHISRIERLAKICNRLGKRMAIVGESFKAPLSAMDAAGTTFAYQVSDPSEADVIVIAGCQANDNSVACKLSQGEEYNGVSVQKDDTIVFSANPIPGRRSAVDRMAYGFRSLGAQVILDKNYPSRMYNFRRGHTHVSGHGSQKDIEAIIEACEPRYFLPNHCGKKQALAAAEIAFDSLNSFSLEQIVLLSENGSVFL